MKQDGRIYNITRFCPCPMEWKLEDCDWIDKPVKERMLKEFDFDWGDILTMESYFPSPSQLADGFGCTVHELDRYCQMLWGMDFAKVHKILRIHYRKDGLERVIYPYAQSGNNTAIGLFGKSVMKLDEEMAEKEETVKIVFDFGKGEDEAG